MLLSGHKNKLVSEFSLQAGAKPGKSSIGAYCCNRVYLTALKWAGQNGDKPVTFLHIPILGTRDKHAEQVRSLIGRMETAISAKTAPPAQQSRGLKR